MTARTISHWMNRARSARACNSYPLMLWCRLFKSICSLGIMWSRPYRLIRMEINEDIDQLLRAGRTSMRSCGATKTKRLCFSEYRRLNDVLRSLGIPRDSFFSTVMTTWLWARLKNSSVIKTIGDSVMAQFLKPSQAVTLPFRCGAVLQHGVLPKAKDCKSNRHQFRIRFQTCQ